MISQVNRKAIRRRVRHRIRKKIVGTASRPRLAIFRSLKHIYVQAIDDASGKTLAQASTQESSVKSQTERGSNIAAAKVVGTTLAERLKEAGVNEAVFDRGGFVFHGRVKAIADAVREAGVTV